MIDVFKFWIQFKKNKIIYSFIAFSIINVIYAQWIPQVYIMLFYYLFPFFIAIGLLSNRKKHHYEAYTFSLPIKHSEIAKARLLLVIVTIIIFQLINLLISTVLSFEASPGIYDLFLGTAISFVVSTGYCIVKDFSLGWMRRKGITAEKIQTAIIILIAGINVAGFITLKFFKELKFELFVDSLKEFGRIVTSNLDVWIIFLPILAIVTSYLSLNSIRYRNYFLDE